MDSVTLCHRVPLVPGTMAGPKRNDTALPKLLNTMATPVAVVRSSGGNQADETAEGAEKMTIPAIPFKMAQIWHILRAIKDI